MTCAERVKHTEHQILNFRNKEISRFVLDSCLYTPFQNTGLSMFCFLCPLREGGRQRQAQSQIQDQPGLYSEVLFKNKSLPHIPVQPGKESHDHHAEGPGRHAQVPEREWAETNR